MFNILKKKKGKKDVKDDSEKKGEDKEKNQINYEKEVEKKVSVYVIPERFRAVDVNKDKAKTMGIVIIVGGVIFLAVLSFLLYYFLLKEEKPKEVSVITPIQDEKEDIIKEEVTLKKEEPEKVIEEPEIEDSKDSYLAIKSNFDRITNFSSYEQLVKRYGSKKLILELEDELFEYVTDALRETVPSYLKQKNAPKKNELGNINESREGNFSTLSIKTNDLKRDGIIRMIVEDNTWKIDDINWTEEEIKKVISISDLSQGADNDKDGLTDLEEALLGSNINESDSDNDGYSDANELKSLYDPAGANKLEDSEKIKKYNNNIYNFSMLYPATWSFSNISEDSIMIKSSDNHFIQIVIGKNNNLQSIDDYYKSLFNVGSINISSRATGGSWSGIRSDDNLTIYLTDNKRTNVFTLSYNTGGSEKIEYKNIFDMIIKSFEIGS